MIPTYRNGLPRRRNRRSRPNEARKDDLARTRKAPLARVKNAGGYTFNDFVRAGIPLTGLMWVALSVILAVGYGL